MILSPAKKTSLSIAAFILSCLLLIHPLFAEDEVFYLENGMQVILKENHSSPMVAAMVFVKSGSKYESAYENGITHFLEHLLFDGTVHMTREELDGAVRDLGGYINAFTRKELTAYLVLLPKQYIDYGLTVQADMLFNSVIPESELPKERKVVIEEIKRDKDSPGAPAEAFYVEKSFAGTAYNRPVLGYQAFIENIPRGAIIDYWKRYYVPKNMTALVIGDFESGSMEQKVSKIFGMFKNPADSITSSNAEEASFGTGDIDGQQRFDTVANVTSTYVRLSFEAPHYSDSDYLPLDLLSRYLGMDEISPVLSALTGGQSPLATEASVYLDTYEEFSRLEISAVTENPDHADDILSTILDQVKSVQTHAANQEALQGIKTSVMTENIYNSEKLHYLGFMIAPMMATVGWDYLQTYPERLSQVTWQDCQRAAADWLAEPDYIATVVKPGGESGSEPYLPEELSAEEVTSHFDTVSFSIPGISEGTPLIYPATDSIRFELADNAEYHREILDNGLTLLIKRNPDTRVFAFNVLGKNRSANEPDGKEGITDFVNRCVEKGTVTRDATELSRDLSRIGANVTLYDNPWIPYDDRYTTRSYSFMKFETVDQFAEKGFHLFTEMILHPSFDPVEVENVRRSMIGMLMRSSGSPSEIARNNFYATLFANTAYAKPISGTTESIGAITIENLRAHHAKFYAPSNLILSIVSNQPIDQVRQMVLSRFGVLKSPETEYAAATRPEPVLEIKTSHTELDKEQISLYIGSLLPGASDPDAAAIDVATSILSERLYLNLREKQGLAYSIGAGSIMDRSFGWTYCSMGTGAENYSVALDGILLQVEKLKLDGPTEYELSKAKNQLWGRLMSAKLSSINQAYYLAADEYLGLPVNYDPEYLSSLSRARTQDIRRVAAQHFRTDAYVLATAGKLK